ncbi:small acid-soluble spore protein P [Paenibacillus sacheonensis]|uniref:Small acid-soluble spore protein P n=1 Tax=Paenibacillus sacheonensis TaxID=742054 RepID=A0A7X4YTS7_9BACL|nr:small acid-soluble spore protein P [Paenibacillus sacheonensis]MBM7567475.1 small acid-soluble spore protein P (minor) [Paenibacillus sacheonensis]NBC71421.1 small acid-soluble spore protein P [Paenibacillus sacheonensis]
MGKPKSVPVQNPYEGNGQPSRSRKDSSQPQEPLSGSKKTKQANHVDHHNPQG